MTLGKAIKFIRIQRGLRQADVAEKAGCSIAYISLLECDRRNVTVSTLTRISKVLRIPLFLIFFLVEQDQGSASALREKLAALVLSIGEDEGAEA